MNKYNCHICNGSFYNCGPGRFLYAHDCGKSTKMFIYTKNNSKSSEIRITLSDELVIYLISEKINKQIHTFASCRYNYNNIDIKQLFEDLYTYDKFYPINELADIASSKEFKLRCEYLKKLNIFY